MIFTFVLIISSFNVMAGESLYNDGVEHYFVVDDQASARDVILLQDLLISIELESIDNEDGSVTVNKVSQYHISKINSEVNISDFENRVTVFIYKEKAIIIVGKNSPAKQHILAADIQIFLKGYRGGIPASTKLSSEIKSDDLRKAIEAPPLLVVDDQSPPGDHIIIADVGDHFNFNNEFKTNSLVTINRLDNRVTVFIYKGEGLIIVGEHSPAKQHILAADIQIFLKGYRGGIPASIKLSSEIKSDDLRKAIGEAEEVEDVVDEKGDCIDSDSGIDYYTRGKITHSGITLRDSCATDFDLNEFYCNSEGGSNSEKYRCQYGCKDGACVQEETLTCKDTDEGKNYYKKGLVTWAQEKVGVELEDCCLQNKGSGCSESGNLVLERFCTGQYSDNFEVYNCVAGCSDGACRPFYGEEEEIELIEDEIESSTECTQKSCSTISEQCIADDKIVVEQCKIYIKKNGKCEESTFTNSRFLKYACDKEKTSIIKDCQGCQIDKNTCIPFGTRLEKQNVVYYCDISKDVIKQKEDKISCQNSYECLSNNCKASNCAQICEGCLNEDIVCIPFGTRTEKQYCDIDYSFKDQKIEDGSCNNNYECSTNICVNNQCISPNLIQKIIAWFNKLFG